MNNETLIANLKKQKGWTQKKCGLSVRTIQRLESGEDASVSTLSLIAQSLDVRIAELFETIANGDKKEEISNYNSLQNEQVSKRKTAHSLYTMTILIFTLLMLCLSQMANSGKLGLLWFFMWPIGFLIIRSIDKLWFESYLDNKYPLTAVIDIKKSK